MKNNISIFVFKPIQTDDLPESLCCFSCEFKIFDRIKSNCLFKILILHTVFHSLSPSYSIKSNLIIFQTSFVPALQVRRVLL